MLLTNEPAYSLWYKLEPTDLKKKKNIEGKIVIYIWDSLGNSFDMHDNTCLKITWKIWVSGIVGHPCNPST